MLSSDHAEIDGLLEKAFAALADSDGASAFEHVDLLWARLAMHIRAEHLHLFPALLAANPSPGVIETLERLKEDHNYFMREFVQVIKLMRGDPGKLPADIRDHVAGTLRGVKQRLEHHNRIEEGEIYPLAEGLSLSDGKSELPAKIKKELDNLPPRFANRDQ